MKIGFPVQQDEGLNSAVFNHFGSAPMFIIVDTHENTVATILNRDQHHAHGSCNPLKALDDHRVDAIVVGGIGAGALTRLNQLGITVHRSQGRTINENISLFAARQLPEMTLKSCCGGHSHGGECAH